MIKLMIVDDEISIRKGMKKYISWDAWGIELAAEAENAEAALKIAQQVRPDILLTDIRMGEMDGIELAKKMKQMFPAIRLIILSGYSDIEYLQAALHIKAVEYLLKPAGADKIIDAVVRAKEEILDERKKWDESREKEAFFDEHLPIIQMHFLDEIMRGRQNCPEEIVKKAEMLNIPMMGPAYCCLAMDARSVLEDDGYKSAKELDMNFWQFSQNMNHILKEHGNVFWCETGDSQFLFLLNAESKQIAENRAETLAQAAAEQLNSIYSRKVYIGIGAPVSNPAELGKSWADAERALLCAAWDQDNQIIRAFPSDEEAIQNCRGKQKEILKNIVARENETAYAEMLSLYEYFKEKRIDFGELKRFYRRICLLILQVNAETPGEEADILAPQIDGFKSAEELQEWMKRFWQRRLGTNENAYENYSDLTRKTIRYIKEHYAEDVTLQRLSKIVFVSPNYLGRIFFEDVGCRLGDWVNRYRIEKAKELLVRTDKKTYEIAEAVGFGGYKYFSVCFLKYVGCSARDYRNHKREPG